MFRVALRGLTVAESFDVFVCYGRADRAWVRGLAEELKLAGLRVFYDEWEILAGDHVVHRLDEGIRGSAAGVVVVSPDALAQPWVAAEYAAMLHQAVEGARPLVPVLLKDAELPPFLGSRAYVDFRGLDRPSGTEAGGEGGERPYRKRVAELVAGLRGARSPTPPRPRYDVFLSYGTADLPAATRLADLLEARGVRPFLDRRHLVPGAPVQEAIEGVLLATEAVAVLVGPGGLGSWHHEEMRAALNEAVRRRGDVRVIPVLLPGSDAGALPPFLARRLEVDLRRDTGDPAAIESLVAGIRGHAADHAADSARVRLPDTPAPYPSLRAFTEHDADRYFGRSAETAQLLDRVRRSSFTAVVGASGSGKSSLVLAGLLPSLPKDAWAVRTLVPGAWPLRSLADALAATAPGADILTLSRQIERDLAGSADELAKIVGTLAGAHLGERRLLLVIDQFEEVFTHPPRTDGVPSDVHAFIANVCAAARHSERIRVVITLRADFLQHCLDFGELRLLLEPNQLLLGALDDRSLRESIMMPALAVGAMFEGGLVDRILADMRGRSGALPLLQTALAELWHRRRGVWLAHPDYDQIHGIGGALNQLADELYAGLSERQRKLARLLFLRLVALGEGGAAHTRRRVDRRELDIVDADPREIEELVLKFSHRDVRLVTAERDTIEIVHEALIDSWAALRSWLRENAADLRTHRLLTEAAAHWDEQGRDDSYLYRGLRLTTAVEWSTRNGADMSRLEAAFLTASGETEAAAHAREQSDRTLARAGQSLFELETSPEKALALVFSAALDAADSADADENPLVQRAMFHVLDRARVQRILRGHTDRISSVAWHPDGSTIASGSYDGTVRIWDVATGRTVAVLAGHQDSVTCVAFDATGARLASGSWDNTAKIWDVGTCAEVRSLAGHDSWVSSVTWSPTGRFLATGSRDNTGRIWDVSTGETVCVLRGHQEWVRSVEWHPSETTVLTGSYDHTAALWEIPSGRQLAVLRGHEGPVPTVAWSADGRQALTGSEDGTLCRWDMQERRPLRTIRVHTSPVYSVAWADGEGRAVTGSEDGRVRIFDVESGELLGALPGHTGWISGVAWSPDRRHVVSGSEDRTARIASIRPGFEPRVLGRHAGWVSDASWHPDGRRVASAGQDGAVRVWDVRPPAGTAAGVGTDPGASADTGTGTDAPVQIVQLAVPDPMALAWSPSGTLLACGDLTGRITVWDARSWAVLAAIQGHEDRISALAWTPDERRLASAGYDGSVRLWDPGDGGGDAPLAAVRYEQWVCDIAWNPDGTRLAIAAWQDEAHIWQVDTEADDGVLLPLRGHSAPLHSTDWSRSGRHVLTSSGDGTTRVWDAMTGRQLHALGSGEAHDAAFSPARQHLATGSRDGNVRLWSIVDEPEMLVSYEHPAAVLTVAWHPAGTYVLSGAEDGMLRLWPASSAFVFRELRERVRHLSA
ncbi:WD40 repeat-containing protein [Frankia sp. QA3]|nr:WD40 repeat-containing protein [Frankia sp. QA3]